jgi:hypothetical protein
VNVQNVDEPLVSSGILAPPHERIEAGRKVRQHHPALDRTNLVWKEVLAVADILPLPLHETFALPSWRHQFWGHVTQSPDSSCWIWAGPKGGGQYGSFAHSNWGTARPHRIMYMWVHGPIPGGKVIDHLCRNRLCVSPDHLEAITDRENILRGNGSPAQNARATHCKDGHPLTGDNVIQSILEKKGERQCRICTMERSRVKHYRRPTESPNAGQCVGCGRLRHICANGTLHKHRLPDKSVCPGSGQPPVGGPA